MMKNWTLRMLTFTATVTAVVLTSCKNDGNDPPEPPAPPPTSIDLPKAYAVRNPDNAEKTVRLIFSDYNAEFIEGFSGEGHCISLMIEASGIVSHNRILLLPEGKYTFDGSTLRLVESQNCSYSATGTEQASSRFVSGSITVVKGEENKYAIDGELVCEDRTTRKFSYRGIVAVDPGAGSQPMIAAEAVYDNKFIEKRKFAYLVTLTDNAGQSISLDICAGASNYFTDIPTFGYTFSESPDAPTEMGLLLKSDQSYYTLLNGGKTYPIEEGTISLAKTDPNSYTITGKVSAKGERGIDFSFIGLLPIERANLCFKNGEVMIDGQSYGFNYFDYTFFTHPNDLDDAGERFMAYITTPVDHCYEYLPLRKGKFTVDGSDLPLKPNIISSNLDWSDTGFKFYDNNGGETLYALTGGALELTESTLTGTKYAFKFTGKLDSATEEGTKLAVDLTWEGTLDYQVDYAGYWYSYTAHPFSTLKSDLSRNDFTQAYFNEYGAYWVEEGGPKDRSYIQLYLMPSKGYYKDWYYEDGDPNNHYLQIGLNLPGEMPSSGVPTGTYELDKDGVFAPNTFMGGNIMSGYSNRPFGTNFFNGSFSEFAPWGCGPNDDGGKIVITKTGDTYTIVANGYDDLGRKAHKLSATYTGKILDLSQAPLEVRRQIDAVQQQAPAKAYKHARDKR